MHKVGDGKRPAPDGKAIPKPSAAPTHRPAKVQKTDNGAASESKSPDGASPEIPEKDKGDGAFPEFMSLGAPKPKAKLAFPASLPLKQLAKVLQVPPAPEAQAPDDISHQFHVGGKAMDTDLACRGLRRGSALMADGAHRVAASKAIHGQYCLAIGLEEQCNCEELVGCQLMSQWACSATAAMSRDLSDNEIGTDGLDKLFQVLRDHRVPCVVLKAYRNSVDDSFVDTLVEYLYTQPEAFPMHGIHISHNNISDKGASRLIRAAAQCGHYPRLTTRLPLWLRLEVNSLENPQKVIKDANDEGFKVCLMQDGLCSRDNCDHYSGVHVQLPYFLNQPAKGLANVEQFGYSQLRPVGQYSSTQGVLAPQAAGTESDGAGGAVGSSALGVSTKAAPPKPSFQTGEYQWNGDWNGQWSNEWNGQWNNQETWGRGRGRGQKGWNGGKGGWSGREGGRGRLWQGKALVAKVKKDIRIPEGQTDLGFHWRYCGEGKAPRVTSVSGAFVSQTAKEVLQSVLLQIGEVKDVKLTCTRPWQQSFLSGLTSMEGYGLFGSQDAKGGFVDGSTEFAFEVVASDPNDFEPLLETLLLEAECGGARHLLPMLAEQLCSDDLATPRHLKVRIEVSKESQT
ncbi:unnamed protein product [Cladocopium goreaui]|uniref:Phosphodiesterase n=1 Tax=Cladocopium goreaui TaxID=2562237 RepID=A0A9P1DEP0_9DINO|nr:unnamed protein product [Cladocopium goreaui]